MKVHLAPWCALLTGMVIGVAAQQAIADGLSLAGSTFPIRICRIQSIRGGQVVYTDPSGQRQQRSLDDVATLSFENLAALDEAEQLIAERDLAAGARRLMQALLAAQTELQQEWIHARLSRIHDARGEYVQAAGHAAAVMAMTDDAYWARLEPVSQPNEPGYPAASESLHELENALRVVKAAALSASVKRMVAVVEPIEQRLKASYDGPTIEPGSTVSGISRAVLSGSVDGETSDQSPPPVNSAPQKPAKPLAPAGTSDSPRTTSPPAPTEDGKSLAGIDVLLREKKFKEAVTACERIAADPRDRDLAQFLFQYGTALQGAGRTKEAAVMFVRDAVLFPSSQWAGPALIHAAAIHSEEFKDAPAARRLLEKAVAIAEANQESDVVVQARQALQSLDAGQSPAKEP